MRKQTRKSLLSKLLGFILKLIKEQTPSKEEFKTYPTKVIARILLMFFCIVFCLFLTVIILGLYLFSLILKILGSIFLFGVAADFVDNRKYYKHFE